MKGGEEESRPGHVVEGVGHHCRVLVEGVASRTPHEVSAVRVARTIHCLSAKETKVKKVWRVTP